jgi:hypothetical protein
MRAKCLFCDVTLDPGGVEHVFLAALGGRLKTRAATCQSCNNHFATDEGGKIDDALADALRLVRCGLMIWTGRGKPPPTLQRAGRFPGGAEYDLAPGFVPVTRRATIPDLSGIKAGDFVTVHARDVEDVQRILAIARQRGLRPFVRDAKLVQTKAPITEFNIEFDGPKSWRAIAKTAVIGAVVLFGNEVARVHSSPELLASIRVGVPAIEDHAGWDYVNPWPKTTATVAHRTTPRANLSGFEHSLVLTDIGSDWIGYVTLFGAFRFSVRMGGRSGLAPKGLALNPRAFRQERFELQVDAPTTYKRRSELSAREEHPATRSGVSDSFKAILRAWQDEAARTHFEEQSKELADQIMAAGDDEAAYTKAIAAWTRRIAALEGGDTWEQDLDTDLLSTAEDS